MTDDTKTDAERYADTIADELEELERLIRDGGTWEDDEPGTDPLDSWRESLLDVDATVSLTTNELTSVTITRTIGGPACWLECHGDEYVRVRVVWGSDESYRTVYAPSADSWAWEWASFAVQLV